MIRVGTSWHFSLALVFVCSMVACSSETTTIDATLAPDGFSIPDATLDSTPDVDNEKDLEPPADASKDLGQADTSHDLQIPVDLAKGDSTIDVQILPDSGDASVDSLVVVDLQAPDTTLDMAPDTTIDSGPDSTVDAPPPVAILALNQTAPVAVYGDSGDTTAFFPTTVTYIVTNTGTADGSVTLATTSPWLSLGSAAETAAANGGTATFVVSVNTVTAAVLATGKHAATLNFTSGAWSQSVTVDLTIYNPGTTGWVTHSGNPVLSFVPGGWETSISPATVTKKGAVYSLYYHGVHATVDKRAVGLATSSDGIAWTKEASNPVLEGSNSGWDANVVNDLSVIEEGGSLKSWYAGADKFPSKGGIGQVGYATSVDGINFAKL
jgi:hypothetical protein